MRGSRTVFSPTTFRADDGSSVGRTYGPLWDLRFPSAFTTRVSVIASAEGLLGNLKVGEAPEIPTFLLEGRTHRFRTRAS